MLSIASRCARPFAITVAAVGMLSGSVAFGADTIPPPIRDVEHVTPLALPVDRPAGHEFVDAHRIVLREEPLLDGRLRGRASGVGRGCLATALQEVAIHVRYAVVSRQRMSFFDSMKSEFSTCMTRRLPRSDQAIDVLSATVAGHWLRAAGVAADGRPSATAFENWLIWESQQLRPSPAR